ncbi:MAG: GNAT family N-acetyltransferase [Candidatus Eremiobacteraeota bacterium]|nr:GNAT family N-acetyltransferase [Candidatus Eremiobacteraeota bacterium]
MTPELTLKQITIDDERWLLFCERSSCTLFQTPKWCHFIAEHYEFRPGVAAMFDGDRIIAGLPFATVDDFRGVYRVTFPFTDACDPVGSVPLRAFFEDGETLPWRVRGTQPSAEGDTRSSGVYQTLELPPEPALAVAKFHQKQRVNAMRAPNAGATHRLLVGEEGLELFYPLFSRLRKEKFRMLPQPRRFFSELLTVYAGKSYVIVTTLGTDVLAAMIVLEHDSALYCKYSASNRAFAALRPSNHLFSVAIDFAISRGFAVLDLGISTTPGLARFKEHLGAAGKTLYAVEKNPISKSKPVEQVEKAIQATIDILTDSSMPLEACQRAGGVLYRFFA